MDNVWSELTGDEQDVLRSRTKHIESNIHCNSVDLTFYRIHKNASTTLKTHAMANLSNGWSLSSRNIVKRNICVILRDPAQRFCSAMNMFINSGKHGPKLFSDNEFIATNRHIVPQTRFIEQLENTVKGGDHNISYFYLTDSIIPDINKYYNINITDTILNKGRLKLITEVNQDIIKEVYHEDYTLIENTNFVNI